MASFLTFPQPKIAAVGESKCNKTGGCEIGLGLPGAVTVTRDLAHLLTRQRRNHPAWLLIASRNGPLTIASLKSLVDAHPEGIALEDAVEDLAESFSEFANDPEFDVGDDHASAARRELRQWLKRGLIVERDGKILATDALQRAFMFLESLQSQVMTSTASRLATVQRAIEELAVQLSHNKASRAESLKMRIAALEKELADVEADRFEILAGSGAEEGVREVYQLAVSLNADFRRVEDSYRAADRTLRQRIITEKQNRGEIVDELLDGHEALVQTAEGQVFESFHQQLVKTSELEQMKQRLRAILENESTNRALHRKQKAELRSLVSRLVQEAERVIQARARSERDVRGFLKSGLADEQIRVGAILQEIFQAAFDVDWQSQKTRRTRGPLPPIAISTSNLPIVQRFLFKQVGDEPSADLDLTVSEADPTQMDDEFWRAYRALDREQLFKATVAQLRACGKPLTLGELAQSLPPTHDLETLAFWLAMAREAGIEPGDQIDTMVLFNEEDGWTRFFTPWLQLTEAAVENLESGNLE